MERPTVNVGAGVSLAADRLAKKKPRKLRVRKCKSVLVVPAERELYKEATEKGSRYECQKDAHDVTDDYTTWHEEKGVVEGPHGGGQEYLMSWRSISYVKLRRRTSSSEKGK